MKVLALAIVMLFVTVPAYAAETKSYKWGIPYTYVDVTPKQCLRAMQDGVLVVTIGASSVFLYRGISYEIAFKKRKDQQHILCTAVSLDVDNAKNLYNPYRDLD